MIVVNQTFNVSDAVHTLWLYWMKKDYLPNLMAAGNFLHYKIYKLKSEIPDEGHTYAVQFVQSLLTFDYVKNELLFSEFEQKITQKYGEEVVFFRTLLEEIL